MTNFAAIRTAALTVAASAAAWTPSAASGSGAASRMLVDSIERGQPIASEEWTDRLGRLPADAVPELFEIFATGVVATEDDPPGRIELDALQREAVLAAFALQSPTAVRTLVEQVAAGTAGDSRRVAALRVLGEMGRAEDVRTVLTVATPADPTQPVARTTRLAAIDAMARVIARDPNSLWHVPVTFGSAHEGLLAVVPTAVRMSRPQGGLRVLIGLLGFAPEADALILAEIGHLAQSGSELPEPALLDAVRKYLAHTEPALVQGAALAVRRLDDTSAVPDLIRLVRHDDANVRRSVDLALQRVTGRDMRGDASRWEVWYAEQVGWWSCESPRVLDDLGSPSKGDVARALNQVSTRRIYRSELEPYLVRVLAAEDSGLVVLACSVIGRLGSPSAVPHLAALLEHPDAHVAQAALAATNRIRGPSVSSETSLTNSRTVPVAAQR